MSQTQKGRFQVAVIGAGPAGIYAAEALAQNEIQVALINRDIRPGGLAEYGIFHNKYKMKAGLRNYFRRVLKHPNVEYYGNVKVGNSGDLTLDEVREMGFSAVLVTIGAQGTKWLGLPGESLRGVYHAKDLVYHYNQLPPFSQQKFHMGKKVAIIGAGNVMVDIAHWLVRDLKVDEVTAVVRRGAADVKFTRIEMKAIGENIDLDWLDREIERIRPLMESVSQDVDAAKQFILSARNKAPQASSCTKFGFSFLTTPKQILGNDQGEVIGLEVEHNVLVRNEAGETKPRGTGETAVLDVDTVVFAIGDIVDADFGLPTKWNSFIKSPNPKFPVNNASFEAYDSDLEQPIEGVFVAGWAREASSGLVGQARKDGVNGAKAVITWLEACENLGRQQAIKALNAMLVRRGCEYVDCVGWECLYAAESAQQKQLKLPHFRFGNNVEMLEVIRKANSAAD